MLAHRDPENEGVCLLAISNSVVKTRLTTDVSLGVQKALHASSAVIYRRAGFMNFCDECGSRMKTTKRGFLCPKCGNLVQAETGLVKVRKMSPAEPEPIYVVEDSKREASRVSKTCPRCGNDEAFRWFSSVSGEHAGVSQERTVEHLKCTRCLHSWAETR